MAREKSWFVGFTRNRAGSSAATTTTATTKSQEKDLGNEIDLLANAMEAGAVIGGPDPEEERAPPKRPTPVTIPWAPTSPAVGWSDDHPPPNLPRLLASVQRPEAPLRGHLDALNCDHPLPCRADALLPPRNDGSSFLQPSSGNEEAYEERAAELDISLDTGFRALAKKLRPDEQAPRLAHMRNFWMQLESVASYWDKSADQYFDVVIHVEPEKADESLEDGQKEAKRPRTGSLSDVSSNETTTDQPTGDLPTAKSGSQESADSTPSEDQATPKSTGTPPQSDSIPSAIETPIAAPTLTKVVQRYKGRRIGNGAEMPDVHRADMVRAFVGGIASAFQCRVSQPYIAPGRVTPMLQVGNLEQPVRLTGFVSWLPINPDKAKANVLQGPIIGIQERNTLDFLSARVAQFSDRKCEHDLLREVAALLLMAQERRREGKTAVTPGEGKWYATKERWGGGPGGKLPATQLREDELAKKKATIENSSTVSQSMKVEEKEAERNLKKAQHLEKLYARMKPKAGLWNPKLDYKAVGKVPGSKYDEVSLSPPHRGCRATTNAFTGLPGILRVLPRRGSQDDRPRGVCRLHHNRRHAGPCAGRERLVNTSRGTHGFLRYFRPAAPHVGILSYLGSDGACDSEGGYGNERRRGSW